MNFEQIKLKADALFSEARFITDIQTDAEYQNALALMDDLIEDYEHGLGIANVPEIGSNTLVSKVLNGKRNLTRNHIEALSERFGVSPALFF